MTQTDHVVRVDTPTETRNQRTLDIDSLSSLGVLERLNDEDTLVPIAVRSALPAVAQLVDAAVERYGRGGTVHYFGAGTSGRIATLDAAELPPTFSVDPERTMAHLAGGAGAVDQALESAEDRAELGREAAAVVGADDVAIGIAASGRTPWVKGALEAAAEVGAFTALVSSAPRGPIAPIVDVHVYVDTGPEAISGSTRLKAGTAQKLVLNGFSTALMVRLGKTYSNLMVDVARKNAKLRGRVLRMMEEATGASESECSSALDAADGETKTAIVSLLANVDAAAARAALEANERRVRDALVTLDVSAASSPPNMREAPME